MEDKLTHTKILYTTLEDLSNYNILPFEVNKLEYTSYIIMKNNIEGKITTSKGGILIVKLEEDILKVEYRTCILNELYYEVDIYLGVHKVLKVVRNGKEVFK